AICVVALSGVLAAIGRIQSMPTVAAVPTQALPAPIIIIASPQMDGPRPTPAPTPAAVVAAVVPENALRRAVVAWDSPNGSVIGAIEQGRAYTVLAKWGSDWLQADVSGSGVV